MLKENIVTLVDFLSESELQQNPFFFQKHSIPLKVQTLICLFLSIQERRKETLSNEWFVLLVNGAQAELQQ